MCTLGGAGSAAPTQFKFYDENGGSGYLAFTPLTTTTTSGSSRSSARPLLLVTDHGHDAVHVVDVVGGSHAGYLASPGSIAGPRGVAASGASPLVAVSAWKKRASGDHMVVVSSVLTDLAVCGLAVCGIRDNSCVLFTCVHVCLSLLSGGV